MPLLRGRDVQRYATEWALLDDDKWMINTHNGIKEQGVPPVDVKRDYPALWRHLNRFKAHLQPRADQGDHWTNLRNCAYVDDFQKPKIIYQDIAQKMPFYLDFKEGFFFNNTCWMMTGENVSLAHLAALFNSSIFRCCFKDNFPEYSGHAYRLFSIFFEKIPVKKPSATEAALFEALVPMVQAAKAAAQTAANAPASQAASFLEEVIDACVMELYFSAHMAEKKLSLHQHVAALLPANANKLNDKALTAAAIEFHSIANASQHPVRNILIRIPVDSPDLLAVIQREGAV